MAYLRATYLGLGLLLSIGSAEAQFLPSETVQFGSTEFSDQQFLNGSAPAAEPVTLKGLLLLRDTAEPQPVVILLHGSDGPDSSATNGWRSAIKAMGYGTLTLDSFSGRGLGSIGDDLAAASSFTQVYDAYRVVEQLSADPRIDPDRFVMMGFSRGGIASLYASLARFHEAYGPVAGQIAGYLPFYPSCNFELKRGTELVDAPVREFHGSADDGSSPAVCKAYIDSLAAAGADIEMTIYEGARHAFDASLARFVYTADDTQHSFDCMRVEGEDGVLLNQDTGQPFSYADACVRLGPTYQYDKAATEAAVVAVKGLLADWVGPPAP
jgi:dienelactone hydrolase